MKDAVIDAFVQHGDLGHIALLLWASGASALLLWALKELAAANRRFENFITELAHLNKLFGDD